MSIFLWFLLLIIWFQDGFCCIFIRRLRSCNSIATLWNCTFSPKGYFIMLMGGICFRGSLFGKFYIIYLHIHRFGQVFGKQIPGHSNARPGAELFARNMIWGSVFDFELFSMVMKLLLWWISVNCISEVEFYASCIICFHFNICFYSKSYLNFKHFKVFCFIFEMHGFILIEYGWY